MKTLIIIPSRLSATRLPGKPLLKINGLSIISHVFKKAVDTNIGEVYVAAQDQEIIDDVQQNGGQAILTNDNHKTGTDRIELYTEPYAANYHQKEVAVKPFSIAAEHASKLGLGINAGHDLSLENLKYFAQNVPHLNEVSIGHALIADALYFGLENTINMYKAQLRVETWN